MELPVPCGNFYHTIPVASYTFLFLKPNSVFFLQVGIVITKDLSRLGRDYLKTV